MFIDDSSYQRNGKTYRRTLLRNSYRVKGKVRHDTIANLSSASEQEIQAMKLALKHKNNLKVLGNARQDIKSEQGLAVGAVWFLAQLAKRLGIPKALGYKREAKLGLWMVMATVIAQGSRLSAVRLAGQHAVCDVLGLDAFNEDDLYAAMDWLADNQAGIEKKLFDRRYKGGHKPQIYLYDVTSSYLEGEQNELGAYGYNLTEVHFNYISAISKPQIETLLNSGVIQLGLFEDKIMEIQDGAVRYILRRNPIRAQEIALNRASKLAKLQEKVRQQNIYLKEHPKAKLTVALRRVNEKTSKLKTNKWVGVVAGGRTLQLNIDEEKMAQAAKLDGCYAIKTDLPKDKASAQIVHDRYKSLAQVEWAFRTMKSTFLEMRGIFVRKENRTRAHVFIIMLAYLLAYELGRLWNDVEATIEEGMLELSSICGIKIQIGGEICSQTIPEPRQLGRQLLERARISLPDVLPCSDIKVVTRKKLVSGRKRKPFQWDKA